LILFVVTSGVLGVFAISRSSNLILEPDYHDLTLITNTFINQPDFFNLGFSSYIQEYSCEENHFINFDDDGISVRWRVITKYIHGSEMVEEWNGIYKVDQSRHAVLFQFETSKWFHQAEYHYFIHSKNSKPIISLQSRVPKYGIYLGFTGPQNHRGNVDIRLLAKLRNQPCAMNAFRERTQ
jgi:hypothetical protein